MFINLTTDGSLQFEPQDSQEQAMLAAFYEQTGDDRTGQPNAGERVFLQAGERHARIVIVR